MTFDEWWEDFVAEHDEWKYADSAALRRAAFQAGAASRDAEVAKLKEQNWELISEKAPALVAARKERDQLRAQSNLLREAIISVCCDPDGTVCIAGSDGDREIIQEALAATPEQSLAAYRDAEIAELKEDLHFQACLTKYLMPYQERAVLAEKERDRLRANINMLRDAFQTFIDEHEECQDADEWMAELCSMEALHVAGEALATTPEQSLAEYRNKVIEECAAKCKDKHINGNLMYDYREECEAAILDMKEQP